MDLVMRQNVVVSTADWVVVALYLGVTVYFAVRSRVGQKTSADYFLAGRSTAGWIVAISLFATLFSTVSFVCVPGEVFKNGILLWLLQPGPLLFLPLGLYLFTRFFYFARVFSVYEYLESRFFRPLRLYGSFTFVVGQTIYAGSVFFSAAKIFETLMGWSPLFTICAVGLFTVIYTTAGGMKAVLLTDVFQGIIAMLGIFIIMFVLLAKAGFDLFGIIRYAGAHGHGLKAVTESNFYKFDLHDRFSFWILILQAAIGGLSTMCTNQTAVQRLLSAKDYKSAKTGIYGHMALVIIMSIPLYGIGLGLYYFYGPGGGVLPQGIEGDQVLGYFVNSMLPAPLPGLIIAALMAALMSTVSSVVNSQANLIHRDFLVPFRQIKEHTNDVLICKIISGICGALGILFAIFLYQIDKGTETTVLEIIMVVGSFAGGPMLYAFLFGVLSKRISGKAMLTSLIIGGLINIPMPFLLYFNVPADQRISFMWVPFPGTIATIVLAFVLSIWWPNKKDLTNLTLWTLTTKTRELMSHGTVEVEQS
jgi:SSS family transporter